MNIQELNKKYNLGVTLDEDGRFYVGKNNTDEVTEKLIEKHDKNHKHNRFYPIAKELKEILKKEFNLNASVSAKIVGCCGDIKVTFKAPLNELKKSFEELNITELNHYISKIWNYWSFRINDIYLQPENPRTKELYELNCNPRTYALNDLYREASEFANRFLKSFNYDHTGSFIGDCDYCDCDFYTTIEFEATDINELELIEKENELIQKIVSEVKNA